MKTPIGSITKARRFHWRAFVLSAALYIGGLAVTILSAGHEIATYVGYGLIAVGAIALAAALVDAVSLALNDLRIAVILAFLGVIAYALWVQFSFAT